VTERERGKKWWQKMYPAKNNLGTKIKNCFQFYLGRERERKGTKIGKRERGYKR
jgi:hypothetical protein